MTGIRKILFWVVPFLIVCSFLIKSLYAEHVYSTQVNELENRLKDARQREEKAVVIRHVSKQMEEIAYQQKEVSDEQRKEAEFQASENFRMKLRVEEEWKNAVTSQQEAVKAYRLADSRKALAEERQYQAEHAKRVADTLTYLTLGRSLGSLSVTQYKAGNYEIASLLAYAAWDFIRKYRGDVYLSSVFNALSLSAGLSSVWQRHKGGISAITFSPDRETKDAFYTVSKYGELLFWSRDAYGIYRTKTLFFDPQFDFRAAYIDSSGGLRVLSYDGKVLRFSQGKQLMSQWDNPLLPDSCLNAMKNNDCKAPVTAWGHCPKSKQLAIGYEDGTLLLFDAERKNVRKLVGHRSAIAAIVIRENKLYSCSYDRTLRLWNLSAEKLEPVVILESTSWLHSLAFDPSEEMLLAGDENGNLYRLCVSPDRMAAYIRKNLSRNFTHEEWAYYMGNQLPFEVYTSKKGDL